MNLNGSKIAINGKNNVLSLNTKENIMVNWKQLELEQEKVKLLVFENDRVVFDSGIRESKSPFLEIYLPFSNERKKYQMQLDLVAPTGEIKSYQKIIYSSNENLSQASWITRLDNPIEKEFQYFNDKWNMIFEREFEYSYGAEKVFLDICGLGYYTVKINDCRIDDTFLNNDVSNYSKVVYFDTYEIQKFLKLGANIITVELANGWYNPAPIKLLGKYNVRNRMSIGKPCLICQISYLNEHHEWLTINSDTSWQSKNGNYLFNNLFIGERVVSSANLFTGQNQVENKTVKISGPGGALVPSLIRKIKRTRTFESKHVQLTEEGLLIDFGHLISGHFVCTFSKDIQGEIKIFYSEAINGNHQLDYRSCISGIYGYQVEELDIGEKDPVLQLDEIIKDEREFQFENQYVYHSFRYVLVKHENLEVQGVQNIRAYSVYTDLESASHFESSNEQFNLLWQAARETKLNNIHSLFEDCPRERLGYGGDIVALIDSQIYTFDIEQLLLKVFKDFINDQTIEGGIPHTAPYMGIQTNGSSDRAGSLGWQLVLPTIAKKIQQHYLHENFVEKHLDELMAHANYLLTYDYDYIKHCCLADWGSIDSKGMASPDREFCSAMMYYIIIKTYAEIFEGQEIAIILHDRIVSVANSIMAEFYHEAGYFQSGTQSSYAFALASGMLNDELRQRVLQRFVTKIEEDQGIFRTGIFGMSWTYRLLSEIGRDDLIYSWLNRKAYPSFFDMLSKGGDILREHFDVNQGSYNHAMFSSYSTWLIEKIIGIQIIDQTNCATQIRIAPYFPKDMSHASGHVNTISGTIFSHWKRTDDESIQMRLKIPKGIEFELQLNESYQFVQTSQSHSSCYTEINFRIDVV